ncbi:MAG: SURF1 family protein [Gammaproteobacteria bacterium]|nr:SURF1 family protein [Gammaproteobacteria bacterium]
MLGRRQYILFNCSRPRYFHPARRSHQVMRLHFNPLLLPSLAALAVFLLFLRLGFWQLDRAEEKLALQTGYQNHINAAPVDLRQAVPHRNQADRMHWRRCILDGRYDAHRTFLLDNQVYRGAVGYQVFSRFILQDGASVLVDRGWAAAPESRSEVPQINTAAERLTLAGVAKPVPVTGIELAPDTPENMGGNLIRVQRIDLAQIAAQTGWTLLPYVVRLDPDAAGALVWNGTEPGFNRERHLGYAFQWFALAATVLVIYVVLYRKKRRATNTAGS